jgi:uncharacterized protein YbjT (DUF2867 family)
MIVVSEFANRDGVRGERWLESRQRSWRSGQPAAGSLSHASSTLPPKSVCRTCEAIGRQRSSDSLASVLRWHSAIEARLAASGVLHTLLGPSTFADVLMLPSIRQTGRWSGSAPHGRNELIDLADVVEPAVAVHSEPWEIGKAHVLTGPIAVTWPEVAACLTQVLERPIRHNVVSIKERRAQVEAGGGLAPWRVELV